MTSEDQPIKAPMPENIRIEHRADGLTLSYRWFSAKFIFLALFCLFWDGFLVFWYGIALSQDAPWIMLVFPLLHLAVGVFLTYYTVAGIYNRTIITVGQGKLSIQHAPLPWPGSRVLQASEISQLYCEETTSRGRNGPQTSYRLSAVTSDNKKINLLTGFDSPDSARFLERQVEEWLGIRDRRVEGEMPK
jgi:hypothetical protein